jgi:hypothetical protein
MIVGWDSWQTTARIVAVEIYRQLALFLILIDSREDWIMALGNRIGM